MNRLKETFIVAVLLRLGPVRAWMIKCVDKREFASRIIVTELVSS